jgi:hypothetical protein
MAFYRRLVRAVVFLHKGPNNTLDLRVKVCHRKFVATHPLYCSSKVSKYFVPYTSSRAVCLWHEMKPKEGQYIVMTALLAWLDIHSSSIHLRLDSQGSLLHLWFSRIPIIPGWLETVGVSI